MSIFHGLGLAMLRNSRHTDFHGYTVYNIEFRDVCDAAETTMVDMDNMGIEFLRLIGL